METPGSHGSARGKCVVKIGGQQVRAASHAIVIAREATVQEQHAAADLCAHLARITGEELAVVTEREVAGRVPIVVGKSDLLGRLGISVDFAALGEEGIHIATRGPALALAGNRRGVLYACYTFLEDYLGCRWLAPDCAVIPQSGVFDLPEIERRYVPPLEYRSTDYVCARDADWPVRNKLNGQWSEADEARGGKVVYRGFVHTFNALVPPGDYFPTHPEYYSEIQGQRVGPARSQLCLTNPEVLGIAIATVRDWIAEWPEAAIFSVSQNDWYNYCECERCRGLAEREGSQMGPILHFANAITDDIHKDYPDKLVDVLPYQYSRKPPAHVRPRPNVIVRLSNIECCFVHPLESDPYNASFRDDLEGWAKVAGRLWIWDYVINYAHSILPFPNLYVLKPNINFLISNSVTGVYEEANYFSPGGELAELRAYVVAKTLWDPSYDTDQAIDEFVAGYYGAAATAIRDYIDFVHRQVKDRADLHVGIFGPPEIGYLTPEVLAQSAELFDRAEAAVDNDPARLHRVEVAWLPVMYAQAALGRHTRASRETLVNRFERIAQAEGVTMVGEAYALSRWLRRQRS
jgi:hypothetical protein